MPTLAVTLRTRPDEPAVEEVLGVQVHRVTPTGGRWGALGSVLRKLDDLRGRYDLIYVPHFHRLGVPAVVAARARGKRVVLKADDRGEISGRGPGQAPGPGSATVARAAGVDPDASRPGAVPSQSFHPFEIPRRAVLRRADHFVATAEELRREIVAEGVPEGKVTVIPNGVDLTRFRPAQAEGRSRLRERLGLPERALIACFGGRLLSWKGPLVLLEAWRDLVAIRSQSEAALRGPQGLLLFLGSAGGHPDGCEEEARRFRNANGLERSVRFLGDVRNVPDYLRASDLFVLPTWGDAYALALAEAMACGLPCVTTDSCAEGNHAVDGRNALVVPSGDSGSLRQALLALFDDPLLRQRLGEAATVTARELSFERTLERHVELFQRLRA